MNQLLALGICGALLIGCQPGSLPTIVSPSEPPSAASDLPGSTASASDCEAAPSWLISRLEHMLVVHGATLSRIFTLPAPEVSTPPGQDVGTLGAAVWAAALVNGAGVRPQLSTWLVSTLDETADPEIWAADVNAHRYSNAAWLDGPITGAGLTEVRQCVGPVPLP